MSEIAAIALGANLGDRLATLRRAVDGLRAHGVVLAASRVYETAPVGPPQPDYLNAVVLLETALEPHALLDALLAIERTLGRERRERWGARVIDLDLVAYGERALHSESLVLPHPEAHRRAFVLVPLNDVAPGLLLPGAGVVRELVSSLPIADRTQIKGIPDPLVAT